MWCVCVCVCVVCVCVVCVRVCGVCVWVGKCKWVCGAQPCKQYVIPPELFFVGKRDVQVSCLALF